MSEDSARPRNATGVEPAEASDPHDFDALAGPGEYYVEDGLFVFTEAYHLRRGYCCNNDCRHCPYR